MIRLLFSPPISTKRVLSIECAIALKNGPSGNKTKSESKRDALDAGKAVYDDIQLRIAKCKKLGKKSSFEHFAKYWLSQQKARVTFGAMIHIIPSRFPS